MRFFKGAMPSIIGQKYHGVLNRGIEPGSLDFSFQNSVVKGYIHKALYL